MTRHYTHIGEAATVAAVAALPDITGDGKAEPSASDTVTIPVSTLWELAAQLTPENAVEIREKLLELASRAPAE